MSMRRRCSPRASFSPAPPPGAMICGLAIAPATSFVSVLPLDVAAEAGLLLRRHRFAIQQSIARGSQVLAVRRAAARPALVELPAVDELALRVEQVQIGRARRVVGSGDTLSGVEQVWKRVADAARLLGHTFRSVLRVSVDVV